MYIPKQMKTAIANCFYDKEISILTSKCVIDDEGGVNYKGYEVTDSFKGNVNFSNCKKLQEDYGLDYQIDISVTTDYKLVKVNDIIKYLDIVYNVTDVISFDSHELIIASVWRQ